AFGPSARGASSSTDEAAGAGGAFFGASAGAGGFDAQETPKASEKKASEMGRRRMARRFSVRAWNPSRRGCPCDRFAEGFGVFCDVRVSDASEADEAHVDAFA